MSDSFAPPSQKRRGARGCENPTQSLRPALTLAVKLYTHPVTWSIRTNK